MKFIKSSLILSLYQILCIVATFTLVIWCVYLYLLDKDVSTISYQKFHSNEESIYPSISLCFGIKEDELKEKLNHYGVNSSLYFKFLRGNYFSEELSRIPYENVTFNPADHLLGIKMHQEYGTNGLKNINQSYFYNHLTNEISPQLKRSKLIRIDPFNHWYSVIYKCFTVDVPIINDQHLSWISITMKKSVFPGNVRPRSIHDGGLFMVSIGYPNQRLRFSHRKTTWKSEITNGSYNLKFQVRGMEVMQYRYKSSEPCDEDWINYDDHARKAIIRENKCIPSYWKDHYRLDFPPCSTAAQIKNFYMDKNWNKHTHPCRILTKVSYSLSEYAVTRYGSAYGEEFRNNHFNVEFYFPKASYKEIRLVRSLDTQTLIGNAGGYIGLFLGYTILQIPSLLGILSAKLLFMFRSNSIISLNVASYEELERKVQLQEKKIKDMETRENWLRSTMKKKINVAK